MAYTDYDEVTKRYNTIKTWISSDATGSTETKVNSHLVYYAEVELNSLLRSHFSTPFSVTYPTIADIAIDFCYTKALSWRDPEKADKMREALYARIERLKKGEEYIYTDSGTIIEPSEASGSTLWSSTEDYEPTHSMLGAEHPATHIDSNYLQELENART